MCIFSSGKPKGAGILERGVYGEGDGNREISFRATWDQGGQDPIAARWVPSRKRKGTKEEKERGSKKQGDCTTIALYSIFVYIMTACNV
jgi:hypothetical protein